LTHPVCVYIFYSLARSVSNRDSRSNYVDNVGDATNVELRASLCVCLITLFLGLFTVCKWCYRLKQWVHAQVKFVTFYSLWANSANCLQVDRQLPGSPYSIHCWTSFSTARNRIKTENKDKYRDSQTHAHASTQTPAAPDFEMWNLSTRAFQFGQKKSFDSIRFSPSNRFFFDSIRFGNLIN